MKELPTEIGDGILRNIDPVEGYPNTISLQNLRLTNKQLAATTAPFLFSVIPLWISINSLDMLGEISRHPQMLVIFPKY